MCATLAQPHPVTETMQAKCVYCLPTNELRPDQILLRGHYFYLCAPRGQLIEGYLVIAPYDCIGCLSRLPGEYFPELAQLKRVVADFYYEVYGVRQGTFYEQGRAGGGAVIDATGRFPHHAHLCSLPITLDLHTLLAQQNIDRNLSGPHELPLLAQNAPYVYVEGINRYFEYKKILYVAASAEGRVQLERQRLKPTIATLMGIPERGDWRTYPGDCELERVVQNFAVFRQRRAATRMSLVGF